MKKEQIEKALDHGINLLSGNVKEAVIPYDDNVFILKQFLIALATGQLSVAPAVQTGPNAGPGGEPGAPGSPGGPGSGPAGAPPSPNPKTRRAAKKTARKKKTRKKES